MNDKSLVVAKINFRNIKLAYVFTAILFFGVIIEDIVFILLDYFGAYSGNEGNTTVGIGNYLFLLVIFSAILIPSRNFRRMMNLGGKRSNFFTGSALGYVILTAAVSLAGILLYFTYERYVTLSYYGGGSLNVLDVFGWMSNGPVVAFFQQFAFLLLFASVLHTLVAAQEKWYGWAADVLIVAIISVFTPIASLRKVLVSFFHLIIFSPAVLQIASCLVIAAAVYMLNKPIFTRRAI